MKGLLLVCLFCSLVLCLSTAEARTWYINPDGSGDAPTIAAGISSATAGDTVLVACGTYYESCVQMKSGVCLRSITGLPDCVIIDADKHDSVMYGSYLESGTRVEGITLLRGSAAWSPSNPARGGGMQLTDSYVRIASCAFVSNEAGWGYGGGLCCTGGSPIVTDCTFSQNSALRGGGVYFSSLIDPLFLTRCVFFDNSANAGGGGLCCSGSAALTSCTLSGNSASAGGGIYWTGRVTRSPTQQMSLILTNVTLAFATQGGAIWPEFPELVPDLGCCDIYGNAGGDWVGGIAGQEGINGNFSLDPLFCDVAGDNYTLMQCSPCAPGNHPDGWECGLIGALPVGCTGTPVEPTSWGRVKALFR
ncbi:MAG: hypothetical protein AMJ46_06195 [Latescibacteria bacterium DG_63]|nr:MAG: hypothetical protein AMJ46_06195 [Latescibacteria bacterium DG_63]